MALGTALLCVASAATAQTAAVAGVVRDETGGALPGVTIELRKANAPTKLTVSDAQGASQGDAVNGFSLSGMGYRATWNSTDQVPQRALDAGVINRFGALDPSDGGETYRYSGTLEWQRSRNNATTKIVAYGIGYDLNVFSNFTSFSTIPCTAISFTRRNIAS
jgi:hypothetical protein